jgi:hypothetical protein
LRVLDAIYKGAEARGWEVVAGQKYTGAPATKIVGGGHDVILTIHEETTKTPHIPTKAEQARIHKRDTYGIPEQDHQPNGRLRIKLVECYVAKRSNWSDGVRQNVEDLIEDVLDGIQSAFDAYVERDAERERKEQEHRQRKTAALERAYRDFLVTTRVETVMDQTRRWRLAQDLRDYSSHIRRRAEVHGEISLEVQSWLDWVERHLDEVLDPPGQFPVLPPAPSRADEVVREHLVAGAGRWGDVYLDWSRQ